jgi:Spy/CpxP family protein refolding chaperone
MKKIIMMLLLATSPVLAQRPEQGPPQGNDPFAKYFFPPEMVMQRQEQIGLNDAQREKIKNEVMTAQKTMSDIQWRMSGEVEKMDRLLAADVVDETAVLAEVDAMLAAEREMKRAQVALMVRIRNALTPEQRKQLQALKSQRGDD